jgi:hypothetical protein
MQNNSRRISLILGGFMAFVLVAGVVLPLFNRNSSQTTQRVDPTVAPTSTFPPPITDFSGISFTDVYLHPSGLYTIAQPTGWDILSGVTQNGIAQVGMNNGSALSVIDAYIQQPNTPIADVQALSDTLTRETLASTWTRYNRWSETNRRIEGDRLIIDFSIQSNRTEFVARQVSWLQDGQIYSVRVVVPSNGIELLRFLLDQLPQTMQALPEAQAEPFDWQAYYDPIAHHYLRYPQTWTAQATAPGRTASLAGALGEALRVEVQPLSGALDEAIARSFVSSAAPNATLLSVTPVTRELGSGFSVAYTTTNADGEPLSGLAVLLSSGDGNLHSANLRFPGSQIDLNSLPPAPEITPEPTLDPAATPPGDPTAVAAVDPNAVYRDYASVMRSFSVIPPLNLAPQNLPATATPLPTLPPSATPAASNTPEAAAPTPPSSTPLPPTATATGSG